MNPICLGKCSLNMLTIFKKCPFKENGKLSKLFRLVLWGLNLPAGFDTPQNKILRDIRPRRTKSCGVSDPAEQWQSCVHFMAYTCSAGPDTPQNSVLRGIKPPGTTFIYEYFCEFEKELKNILGCEFGDYMGSIHGKKPEVKNLMLLPL